MPKTSLLLLIALSATSSTFACAQDSAHTPQSIFYAQPQAPPVTPYSTSGQVDATATPALITPAVQPPPLPLRPDIPEPDANCVLPPAAGNGIAKPVLSHRTRTLQDGEIYKQTPLSYVAKAPANTTSFSHNYLASLEDTLLALASACSMDKTIVESVDSVNGKLLARREGAAGEMIRLAVSAKEVSPNHTTVTLSSSSGTSPLAEDILDKAAALISGGGSL